MHVRDHFLVDRFYLRPEAMLISKEICALQVHIDGALLTSFCTYVRYFVVAQPRLVRLLLFSYNQLVSCAPLLVLLYFSRQASAFFLSWLQVHGSESIFLICIVVFALTWIMSLCFQVSIVDGLIFSFVLELPGQFTKGANANYFLSPTFLCWILIYRNDHGTEGRPTQFAAQRSVRRV